MLVRALLTADRNQQYLRSRMTEKQRSATPAADFRPFIIADADTGHGGDPARAQPRPALRRGRRARLPHRGPAPGHQEVRPPGRQGAGAGGRADQAPERGALPARRHEGPRHHRRPHRRRGGDAARRPRRRARPAVHPRRHQRQPAVLQGRLPGAHEALLRSRASASSTATCSTRCRDEEYRGRRALARAQRARRAGRRERRRLPAEARLTVDAAFDAVASRFLEAWEDGGRPRDLRRGGGRGARVPGQRGRAARDERRRVAALRRARLVLRGARRRPGRSASRSSGTASTRRPRRATTRSAAASPTPSPSRSRRRRSPTSSGWRPRPPTSTTPASSPRRSTPSSRTRCWPTTCRRRSTGTRPA